MPQKILIVEDEIIVTKDLEALLTGLEYEVVGIASTGETIFTGRRETSIDY